MKNTIITLAFLCICHSIFAQSERIHFGIKGGINYGDNGKIEASDFISSGTNIRSENADNRLGFHFGFFLKASLTKNLYLKPELQFSLDNSSFSIANEKLNYSVKRIDVPILAGISIIGPLHVFGGPSLQYILDTDLENITLNDVKNEFTVGIQFGAGLQLGRINIDVRYERGLSKNQVQSIDDTIRVDTRANQFILSAALNL